jgi:predicted nucleotidyltransferase
MFGVMTQDIGAVMEVLAEHSPYVSAPHVYFQRYPMLTIRTWLVPSEALGEVVRATQRLVDAKVVSKIVNVVDAAPGCARSLQSAFGGSGNTANHFASRSDLLFHGPCNCRNCAVRNHGVRK